MANKNKNGVEIDAKFTTGYQKLNLTNVEAHWCHLVTPDTAFGNNKWCIELHLDDDVAKALTDIGFDIKDKVKDGAVVAKNVLKAKKEVMTKAGKKQTAPLVVGPDGKTLFTEDIGNGSIVNLQLTCKAWPINGAWQMSAYVDAVQVVTHVAYGGGFEDTTGDTIPF